MSIAIKRYSANTIKEFSDIWGTYKPKYAKTEIGEVVLNKAQRRVDKIQNTLKNL